MSIGFVVEPEQAVILRGPRLSGIIKQFIYECMWPELDYLIVDLPPGTGDIQLTLVQTLSVTGALIVTTPQEVAVVDAIKATNMFRLSNIDVPILGVVENMAWFSPAELPGNRYYIFGEGGGQKLAKMANSVLLGQVPLVQAVREGGDSGKPAMLDQSSDVHKAFSKISERLMKETEIRNEQMGPTKIVKVDNG
jgi:ATP-binding protein involved in chromosome partitioning